MQSPADGLPIAADDVWLVEPDELDESGPDDIDESEPDEHEELSADDVSDVLLYTLDWSVQSLLERIGTTLDINPAFQRRDAWATERKSKYIESLMLGLPVPQVVLAEDNTRKGQFIVIDGKQRLVTMKQFAAPNEHFPALRLRRMEFLSQLNGMTFDDVRSALGGDDYAENLLAQPVRTIVVRNWRKPAVLYQIFVRLNQGSLPLSPQELRQALFPGDFSRWINTRSATSDPIHRARRLRSEDFRMRDAEMLLRAVGFQDRLEEYAGNLRAFLDETCERGNAGWGARKDHFEDLARRCESGIERAETVFGRDAFLRYVPERYIRRFNIAVFDVMSLVLASDELSDEEVTEYASEIKQGFEFLCRERPEFQDALKSTTKTVRATATRIMMFAQMVTERTGIQLAVVNRAAALAATVEDD